MKREQDKVKIQDLFLQDADYVKLSCIALKNTMYSFCKGNYEELNKYIEESIQIEKKQDRNREAIIERLFTRETMVFSRSDRLNIVSDTNTIVGHAERVARRLKLLKPKLIDSLNVKIKIIADAISELGIDIENLVKNVMEDFEKAKKTVDKINDIRRDTREIEYEALKILYDEKLDHYSDFIFYEDFITNALKVANSAEDFADNIYSLICKYTL